MKTPTWAIIIGICLILFGGCGASKNYQSIHLPEILDLQKGMLHKMSNTEASTGSDSLLTESHPDINSTIDNQPVLLCIFS